MAACVHSQPVLRTLLKLRRCADRVTTRFFLTGWVTHGNHNYELGLPAKRMASVHRGLAEFSNPAD
jgi:hypothetical protein